MKKVSYLLIVLVAGFVCTAFADEWYEGEESCAYDYAGSIGKAIVAEADASRYTPEYSASELKRTMVENDHMRTAMSVAAATAASSQATPPPSQPSGYWYSGGCVPEPIWISTEPGVITGIPVCFAEDTPVITDKGIKKIGDIKEGDMVLGKDGFKKVVKIIESNGKPNLAVNGVELADVHPFVMENGEVKKAKELAVGDKLYNGVEVKAIEKIANDKKLYDLMIEGNTYYVGDMLAQSGNE